MWCHSHQSNSPLDGIVCPVIGIGGASRPLPPTPPDMRVRIRRFGGLSDRTNGQSRNPERVEVSIRQRDREGRTVRESPLAMGATSRLRG